MPKINKKHRVLQLIEQNCKFQAILSRDSEELSEIVDKSMEYVVEVMKNRYTSPMVHRIKSLQWYDDIFPNLEEEDFQSTVRMNREQFAKVLSLISGNPVFSSTTLSQMPVQQQLAVALYRFGHDGIGASYHEVGHKFGIGDCGTIIRITKRIIEALISISQTFIAWPNIEERKDLAALSEPNFPGLFAYVDGTHVNLEESPALEHPEDYFSRKQRYGLHLQVICDRYYTIRHIKVGRTASSHDAKIFSETDIANHPEKYFSQGEWIAGDSAYRLTNNLITPFRINATFGSTAQRKKFNRAFSKERVKIEQVFGILKGKMASLRELRVKISDRDSHVYACQWIEACCILYNIIREDRDISNYEWDHSNDIYDHEDSSGVLMADTTSGEEKRRQLFQWLMAQ